MRTSIFIKNIFFKRN